MRFEKRLPSARSLVLLLAAGLLVLAFAACNESSTPSGPANHEDTTGVDTTDTTGTDTTGTDTTGTDTTCVMDLNGFTFTNYDVDSTTFTVDSLYAEIGDSADVTDSISAPHNKAYSFPYSGSEEGFVVVELFKGDRKALAQFDVTPIVGSGCEATTTHRRYAVYWLDFTGHGGYTEVQTVELTAEESP